MKKAGGKVLIILTLLSISFYSNVGATMIGFSVGDITGDNTGSTDLIGMDFRLNNKSGNYWIDFYSSADNPFIGEIILNANLKNVTRSMFWDDNLNLFTITKSVTSIRLKDKDPLLTGWDIGDIVNYGESWFDSGMYNIGGNTSGRDVIGWPVTGDSVPDMTLQTTLQKVPAPAPVPEPSTILLLSSGLFGLAWYGGGARRRSTTKHTDS